MKRAIALAIAVSFAATAFGQGELIFNHRGSGSGQVLGVGGVPLVGTTYSGQLYAGATSDSLHPVVEIKGGGLAIFPFPPATAPAALHGYVASQNNTVIVPGVGPGAAAFVQLRVWNNWNGALPTFDSAAGVSEWGGSAALQTPGGLGGPNPPDPDLTPTGMPVLPGFSIEPIPEPATWALLGIGAVALFCRRRK